MFGRNGDPLTSEDVLGLLALRAGRRGDSEVIVHRDDRGKPCAARNVVHRGGVIKKSWVPIGTSTGCQVAAEGPREKKVAWLLRALLGVRGVASQALELRSECGPHRGSWICDFAVVVAPLEIALIEVKNAKWFTEEDEARLREFFRRARDHGFHPILLTDEWLDNSSLISNLALLYQYREHEVSKAMSDAVIDVLSRSSLVYLGDFLSERHPEYLHSVYALLAQGQIHIDLTMPISASTVVRNTALDHGGTLHGANQLFAGPGLSSGW